jgi:hypothetical protein
VRNRSGNPDLERLRSILLRGQKLSLQGNSKREAPAAESLPDLLESRRQLLNYLQDHPEEPEGWNLLSQAQECLLDFGNARRSLEHWISLGRGMDKKALKRLARLRETEDAAAGLGLTPFQLKDLCRFVEKQLREAECGHGFEQTRRWLKRSDLKDAPGILKGLKKSGRICDCSIVEHQA